MNHQCKAKLPRENARAIAFACACLALIFVPLITHAQSRFYYAIENLDDGSVVRRGVSTGAAVPDNGLILAPETRYREWLLNAENGHVGLADFTTPSAGSRFTIPPVALAPPVTPDADSDGLSDDAEFILGTDPANPDTDGDGIQDGAAVQLGLDPGAGARTGVIASTDTPGTAVDVAAFNDIVTVADSERGVSVFNVFNRMSPLIIAQVPTSNALRVAISDKLLAVAGGVFGLTVVDISAPPDAPTLHQVNLGTAAQAVAASGGVAYVGLSSGGIASVDLATGFVVETLSVPEAVRDVAIAGDALYVLGASRLYAVPLNELTLRLAGSVASGAGLRLFVGGGVAYVTHSRGFNTFSVTNSLQPTLITNGLSQQLGWRQIVANGSGFGLAASGATAPDDVHLYDLRDPTRTDRFITTFPTPGQAVAMSIYNGLAYVADSASGLQVVNYLAFDIGRTNPTIALAASFPVTEGTNGVAEEGQPVRITANVGDDVQVRNVEFYLDGVKAATDGNFPFEYRFTAPSRSLKPSLLVQARASDTGGNFTWSEVIRVTLLPDTTPPVIRRTSPATNSISDNLDAIFVFFTEPVDPAKLNADAFQISWAGADHRLGTGDDIRITNALVNYRDPIRATVVTTSGGLADGLYRMVLSSNITDIAGNRIAGQMDGTFWMLRGGTEGDADSDGITNRLEIALGFNPTSNDTDGDGWEDGVELAEGAGYVTNAVLRPRMTFAAAPTVTVALPGRDELGLTGTATAVAQPPVQVSLPGKDELGLVGAQVAVARPPVRVSLPSADELGIASAAHVLAKPSISVSLSHRDEIGDVGAPTHRALPPVILRFEGINEIGMSGKGTTLALPPVRVISTNSALPTTFMSATNTITPLNQAIP